MGKMTQTKSKSFFLTQKYISSIPNRSFLSPELVPPEIISGMLFVFLAFFIFKYSAVSRKFQFQVEF